MNKLDGRSRALGLGCYECAKLFGGVFPVLICVLFLVFDARSAYQSLVLPRTFEETLTIEYMNVLQGEVTEEKRQYVEHVTQEISDIQSQYEKKIKAYQNGEISYEDFTAYITAYNKAMEKKDTVENLAARLDRIDALAMEGKRVDFVFEVGWERVFSCGVDYYLAVFLILILSGIYAFEKRHNFSAILYSTKNGRLKTAHVKLYITLLLSGLTGLVSFAYRVILVAASIGLSCANSPAASIARYESFGGSLFALLLLSGFWRILGAAVLGLLCFSLSVLFERSLPVMTLAALSVLAVPLLHVFDVTAMDDLMLGGMLGGMSPILSDVGIIAALAWSGIATLLTVISFYKVRGVR